eukprot:TRINITY_DN5923_c0_g2_i3.p2 TRINITY_DN5923_c0_g2~~TRINITY_DN5923_c0_g2_i3.p2  ORF type:complete len:115 (+),score=28.92 TRINITY_DN5923_c0_g2_i3:73-417(+)
MCIRDSFKDCAIGIRMKSNKELVGFITVVPITLSLGDTKVDTAGSGFCCVHTKYRSRRMTPIFIKEVHRRLQLRGIWCSYFASNRVISDPFTEAWYYHRCLNFRKLLAVSRVRT